MISVSFRCSDRAVPVGRRNASSYVMVLMQKAKYNSKIGRIGLSESEDCYTPAP